MSRRSMSRRAKSRQGSGPPEQQSRVFPRGATPGNGVPQPQSRVAEVVDRRRTIPVDPAAVPRPRAPAPERTTMVPTDGIVAAIQDGFAQIDERLEDLVNTMRVAHGLAEADDELDSLRTSNSQLTHELAASQQQVQQMHAVLGQRGQVQAAPQPQESTTVAAPSPVEQDSVTEQPAPTPPDDTAQ